MVFFLERPKSFHPLLTKIRLLLLIFAIVLINDSSFVPEHALLELSEVDCTEHDVNCIAVGCPELLKSVFKLFIEIVDLTFSKLFLKPSFNSFIYNIDVLFVNVCIFEFVLFVCTEFLAVVFKKCLLTLLKLRICY